LSYIHGRTCAVQPHADLRLGIRKPKGELLWNKSLPERNLFDRLAHFIRSPQCNVSFREQHAVEECLSARRKSIFDQSDLEIYRIGCEALVER